MYTYVYFLRFERCFPSKHTEPPHIEVDITVLSFGGVKIEVNVAAVLSCSGA